MFYSILPRQYEWEWNLSESNSPGCKNIWFIFLKCLTVQYTGGRTIIGRSIESHGVFANALTVSPCSTFLKAYCPTFNPIIDLPWWVTAIILCRGEIKAFEFSCCCLDQTVVCVFVTEYNGAGQITRMSCTNRNDVPFRNMKLLFNDQSFN